MPSKATKAEIAQRVDEVLRARLDGAQFHDLLQYASEKGWNVGQRQLWNYVAASDRLLAARLEKDRDRLFARHVAMRMALFARCVNAGELAAALAVAKDEAALHGLYPPSKTALTNPLGDREYGAGFTDDERAAIVRAVLARFGLPGPLPDAGGAVGADGQVLPGPAGADEGREVPPGPMAGPRPRVGVEADIDSLFEAEREEPDGGGAGPLDGDP